MKRKRRWVLWAAAASVAAITAAVALLVRPPVPFDFLQGSSLHAIQEFSYSSVVFRGTTAHPPLPSNDWTIRYYRTSQPIDEVFDAAREELRAEGWLEFVGFDSLAGLFFQHPDFRTVQVHPAANGTTEVVLRNQTTTLDRVQAWLWRTTNPRKAQANAMP